MNPQDKKAACERICGPHYSKDSGLHSIAPERCPFADEIWKNPKRKAQN